MNNYININGFLYRLDSLIEMVDYHTLNGRFSIHEADEIIYWLESFRNNGAMPSELWFRNTIGEPVKFLDLILDIYNRWFFEYEEMIVPDDDDFDQHSFDSDLTPIEVDAFHRPNEPPEQIVIQDPLIVDETEGDRILRIAHWVRDTMNDSLYGTP